jgi:hypothetical protein
MHEGWRLKRQSLLQKFNSDKVVNIDPSPKVNNTEEQILRTERDRSVLFDGVVSF